MDLFASIKAQLNEWAKDHVVPMILEIVADVLEAKPTTPDVLRLKAAEFRLGNHKT